MQQPEHDIPDQRIIMPCWFIRSFIPRVKLRSFFIPALIMEDLYDYRPPRYQKTRRKADQALRVPRPAMVAGWAVFLSPVKILF